MLLLRAVVVAGEKGVRTEASRDAFGRMWGGVLACRSSSARDVLKLPADLQGGRPLVACDSKLRLQPPPDNLAGEYPQSNQLHPWDRRQPLPTTHFRRIPIAPWTLSKSPLGATRPNPLSHPRMLRRPRHRRPSRPKPRPLRLDLRARDLVASWPSQPASRLLTTTLSDPSAPSAHLRATLLPTARMRPRCLLRRRRW